MQHESCCYISALSMAQDRYVGLFITFVGWVLDGLHRFLGFSYHFSRGLVITYLVTRLGP